MDLDPPLMYGSLESHSYVPNGNLIGSAIFAGLLSVTNRETDRSHYSGCSNRQHLAKTAMTPNNHNNWKVKERLYPGTHACTDGQHENITPLAPATGWMEAHQGTVVLTVTKCIAAAA